MTNSPRIRLSLGAFLISFSSVFANLATVPPTVSAFYRVAIGGVVLAVSMFVMRWRLTRRPTPVLLLFFGAVFFALDLGFWHRSIHYVGPGLSTLFASFQVFFMTAAGVLFFNQSPTVRQIVAKPIAILGLALIVGIDWLALSPEYRWGVLFGLLTGPAYAGYILSLRQVQASGSQCLPVAELAIISLATAALLAVSSAVEGHSLAVNGPLNLFWLACYGVLCHVCGWLLIASSLRQLPTAVAGLILTLQPILTLVWDILIFSRRFSLIEIVGATLTLNAIYLGSRQK